MSPDISSTNNRPLAYAVLKAAVTEDAAAFRCRRRLQPGGGEGDKVFPPTYAGAVYATEQRRIPGREQPVTCVLLDSVQSQANRMEQALQEALDAGEISLPLITVDFSDYDPSDQPETDEKEGRLLDAVGKITSLQVPHRLADAILRDSEYEGKPFRKSSLASRLNEASPLNATPVYQLCPTALVFGMWDSTGPKGGLGAKFERAIVSEVVGIGAQFGLKTASRIDPIITTTKGIVLYRRPNGSWTLDESEAAVRKGKPVKLGKGGEGKASEVNLGNVTPSFSKYTKGAEGFDPMSSGTVDIDYSIRVDQDGFALRNRSMAEGRQAREGQIAPGGVTIEYAEQITTLSLIALRRLRFPLSGANHNGADAAGHAVLAALGLCAATLAFNSGMGLRSRCLLWPDGPMCWDLLAKPGEPPNTFTLDASGGKKLLSDAVAAAQEAGLQWEAKPMILNPSSELLKLVRLSQQQAVKEESAEES